MSYRSAVIVYVPASVYNTFLSFDFKPGDSS